ncbi:MarR family transcriptional regulator [Variovorax sp. J22R133]|uniref:MarR family winged helix-turn-helix transcriptional regulator n=1 Tax=Variovorax brevis TaxID=3053503 RepID=UPI002578E97F|nr:MarR family transcriptional regulator [Variovorax sp. J22R133]MDM0115477.1 MarR family transcriptional regulator [Variovorax sp. J22R133]
MRKPIDNVNHKDVAPENEVLDLIHAVMHQYRSQQYRVLRDGPHDVTHMDSKVLGFFGRHPGATQSDLAQHSGRDKAQLARLIKGLRDRALLEATVDEGDRRNVRLTLTPEGAAIQRTLQRQARKLSAQAVDGLSDAERAQLVALLGKVNDNLRAG